MTSTLTCADCGTPMQQNPKSRPQGEARCHPCRRARPVHKPHTPGKTMHCADCGGPMWRSKTSLPQGQARCLPCKRKRPARTKPVKRTPAPRPRCQDCQQPCWGLRCRKCNDIAQRIRSLDDNRAQYHARSCAAPGLNSTQRKRLLSKWIRQGRRCAYCTAVAATLDHVVPLVRGGTNWEGNLLPACRSCNSAKAWRTVIEWRTGKRLRPMSTAPYLGKKLPPPKIRAIRGDVVALFKVCSVCSTVYQGETSQCSKLCYDKAYNAERRKRELVPRQPCMDCGLGEFPRKQRCAECHVVHKRLRKRAEKARARERAGARLAA